MDELAPWSFLAPLLSTSRVPNDFRSITKQRERLPLMRFAKSEERLVWFRRKIKKKQSFFFCDRLAAPCPFLWISEAVGLQSSLMRFGKQIKEIIPVHCTGLLSLHTYIYFFLAENRMGTTAGARSFFTFSISPLLPPKNFFSYEWSLAHQFQFRERLLFSSSDERAHPRITQLKLSLSSSLQMFSSPFFSSYQWQGLPYIHQVDSRFVSSLLFE
jgi:hypothetical protein